MARRKKQEEEVWEEWPCSWLLMLEQPIPDRSVQVRLNIANVIRHCRRKDGTPLVDLQVCRRVKGSTPSLVAEVRAELEANGVLAVETAVQQRGGGS